MGGKFLLRLNIGGRPIANKYREGKMKRTLKRELKVLEIVSRETLSTSVLRQAVFGVAVAVRAVSASASLRGQRGRRGVAAVAAPLLAPGAALHQFPAVRQTAPVADCGAHPPLGGILSVNMAPVCLPVGPRLR